METAPGPEDLKKLMKQKLHIAKVHIHGLKRTRDDFAQKIAKQLFDAKTFAEFFQKAVDVQATFNGLSVTSGVHVKLDVGDNKEELVVHLTLKERKYYSGGIQGFMGNDPDTKIGLGAGLTMQGLLLNVLGRAEKASIGWSKGTYNAAQELSLLKPLGSDFNNQLSASLFSRSGAVSLSGFNQADKGVTVSFSAPTAYGTHKLSWNGVWRLLRPLSEATSFSVREQAGHSLKSSLKYEFSIDSRDDDILPSEGGVLRLINELAGFGGDTQFFSKQVLGQYNQQLLLDKVVLQIGASVGHIQSINFLQKHSKPLSVMDKFFLGGPTSLRGFENKGIGPRQKNDALGSDFYWLSSAHLYLPLPGLTGGFADKFRIQAFVNGGNIMDWQSASSWAEKYKKHKESLRLSCGVGLIANFLGAKLELNYCLPLRTQPTDKMHQGFQFGISAGD